MRTGILGGTFDPIHIAHLHAAQCAVHQADLDQVLVIPAGDPWQKAERRVTPANHRLEMCRLAVTGVAGLVVDDREVKRGGPTYTMDTLESFAEDEELFLILGADAVGAIHTWHRAGEVLDRAGLIVAPRPGHHEYDPAHGIPLEMGLLEISATDIRARAGDGRPFRYLVTGSVHDYIVTNGLYTNAHHDDMVGDTKHAEDLS